MKKLLLLLFFTPLITYCQENEYGKIIHDTLLMKNGAKFYIKQKVTLGYGSGSNKSFEFITLSPFSFATLASGQPPTKLGSAWANASMEIKDIKFEGTKRTGHSFYLVLKGGNLSPYWCQINAAMDNSEIVVAGINDKKTLTSATSPQLSVADEIAKLNKLYKDSIITKEEYEAQKKKLLNQ